MRRVAKIILINVITFAVLLAVVNWLCGRYLSRAQQGRREDLPNYAQQPEHAKDIFRDYYRVQHQYEPFVGWKCLPYQGKTLTISREGQRLHTGSATTNFEKTIRFFGGSTMWGEGADNDHTIPALFNRSNPTYRVFNHAQLAYNSRQELDALISLYTKGDSADIVVFYDGVNDAAFLCPKEIKELPAHRLVPMFREKLYVSKSAFTRDLLNKIFTENILKIVHKYTVKKTPENSPYDCLGEHGKAEEIANVMIRNWELAHQVVTERGGKFFAVLQPAAFVGNPRTDHLKLDEELGKNFANVYRHIQQRIKEKNYDWVFDLSNRFDGHEYIYIDFCHVSENGNAIIAKEITNIVNTTQ